MIQKNTYFKEIDPVLDTVELKSVDTSMLLEPKEK